MAIQHRVITHATELSVSLSAAKDELELVGHAHDSKLTRKIKAAERIWTRYTNRAASPEVYAFVVESEGAREGYESHVGYPSGGPHVDESLIACRRVLELPRVPVISVDSVQVKECIQDAFEDEESSAFATSLVDGSASITWLPGECIPPFRRIEYTAGYQNDFPEDYQETILMLVVHLFAERGDVESRIPHALMSELRSQSTGAHAGYFT